MSQGRDGFRHPGKELAITYSATTLDIRGHRGEAVSNTFFSQDFEAWSLAVIFPGLGYTAHMPVLYYPRLLLMERGADVLVVEYDYRERANFRMPRDPERDRWFFDDVAAACEAGLRRRPYSGVTLVGKSLGTLAMGQLLTEGLRLPQTQCIWLTPLLRDDRLRAQIRQARSRSLFVIGTADGHYDPAYLDEVRLASRGESVVLEDADHSLEIKGDTVGSIRALEQIVRATQRFLDL